MNMREGVDKIIALLEKGFTHKAIARDAAGKKVGARHNTAVSWCSVGAIYCVCLDPILEFDVLASFRGFIGNWNNSIAEFNDTHTKGEVVAAWKAFRDTLPE